MPEELPEAEQDSARRTLEALRSCKTCGLRSFVDQSFSNAVAELPSSFLKANEAAFRHSWAVVNYYRVVQEYVSEMSTGVPFVPELVLSDIVDVEKRNAAEQVYSKVRSAHLSQISSAVDAALRADTSSLPAFLSGWRRCADFSQLLAWRALCPHREGGG